MRKVARHIALALIGVCFATASAAQDGALRALDFRIVLAQLAQKVGANGQIAILQAQGTDPAPALVLQGGRATLREVAAASDAITQRADGSYHLTRPLLVWADAHLVIEADDHLFLDGPSGAFLASLGQLDITDATITTTPRPRNRDLFHPFVLVAGQGHLNATGTRFSHLGFGTVPSFTGVAVINRGIFPSNGDSTITGSHFAHMGSLSLISVENTRLSGNHFENSAGTSVSIRASHSVTIADTNIISPRGHGIRISEGSSGIHVHATTLQSPARNGIMIDSRSTGIALTRNTITAPKASGITLDTTFCVALTDNRVTKAKGSGIVVNASAHIALSANTVTRSNRAGITLQTQPKDADVTLTANRLIENRAGLKGTSSGVLHLAQNDFSDQFPRFLDGDLILEARRIARDLRGATPVIFDGAHSTQPLLIPDCTMPGGA